MKQPRNCPGDSRLVGPDGCDGQACLAPKTRPRPVVRLVEVVELQRGVAQEVGEPDRVRVSACEASGLRHRPQLGHQASEARPETAFDVVEHDAGGNAIELNGATGRKPGESLLDLRDQVGAVASQQRAEAQVKPEFSACVADEVQDREAGLVLRTPKSSSELLEEHQCALGRAEKENGVHFGDVHALVEQVHAEHDVDRAVAQVAERGLALVGGCVGRHGDRRQTTTHELVRHEPRVGDADAESQRPHGPRVRKFVLNGLNDQRHSVLVTGVDILQRCDVVPATAPLDVRQVGAVVKAEVLERTEQAPLERVPQPQLHRNSTVEPLKDALAVGALRCCGEAKQNLGFQMIQQASIGRRGGVVELVDDDDVEGVGLNVVEVDLGE